MNREAVQFPTPPLKQETVEAIRTRMREAILRAQANPISPERLEELNARLDEMEKGFLDRGEVRDDAYMKRERDIYNEILASSARAEYLSEFKILIEELLKAYPQKDEAEETRIKAWLAHENAHMNVAQATGHEIIGYIVVFINVPEGRGDIKRHRPACMLVAPQSWSRDEFKKKTIAVLKAPKEYGSQLSAMDKKYLERHE